MLRALLRHDSNLYYPTLLNKHALQLEFRTLEVLECAVPLGWERACIWGGLRAPDFGIWSSGCQPLSCSGSVLVLSPQKLRTHVLSVLIVALIPGEKTEWERKGSGCGCLLSSPPCVTIVSCFLGYRWPRKGHWASAGFWWSSLKRDVSTDLVSFKRTLVLRCCSRWGRGRNGWFSWSWNLEISFHRIQRNHLKDNLEESKLGRPYPALHIAGDLELAGRLRC